MAKTPASKPPKTPDPEIDEFLSDNAVALFDDGNMALSIDVADLTSGLGNLAQSIGAAGGVGGGMAYLVLQPKEGWFGYGQEKNRVEDGSLWGVNIRSLRHGFTAWRDGAVANEIMVPANTPCPPVTSLPDVGAKYDPSYSVELKCLSGEDKGIKVLYKTNSLGARGWFQKLIEGIAAQAQKGARAGLQPDDLQIFPIVELRSDSYNHKQYGKTVYPVFWPVRWVDRYGRGEQAVAANQNPGAAAEKTAHAEPPSGVRRRRVG